MRSVRRCYQDVERAEALRWSGEEAVDGGLVRDVAGDRDATPPAPRCLSATPRPRLVDVRDDDRGALGPYRSAIARPMPARRR